MNSKKNRQAVEFCSPDGASGHVIEWVGVVKISEYFKMKFSQMESPNDVNEKLIFEPLITIAKSHHLTKFSQIRAPINAHLSLYLVKINENSNRTYL